MEKWNSQREDVLTEITRVIHIYVRVCEENMSMNMNTIEYN